MLLFVGKKEKGFFTEETGEKVEYIDEALHIKDQAEAILRFNDEATNVIYDIEQNIGEDNSSICIIEEYIDGKSLRQYVNDETGTRKYYRIYEFIENAVSYDQSQDKEIVYNTGKAFGNFQRLLGNYPMSKLEETIKDFHDTKKRYDKLMDDIKIDSEGRVAEVANEIVFILMREDICSLIMDDLGTEEIPYRVCLLYTSDAADD